MVSLFLKLPSNKAFINSFFHQSINTFTKYPLGHLKRNNNESANKKSINFEILLFTTKLILL